MPPTKMFQVKLVVPIPIGVKKAFQREALLRGITMTNLARIVLEDASRRFEANAAELAAIKPDDGPYEDAGGKFAPGTFHY